jgi:tRNA C32,U32 (ribose-2'-O)-methylase TrmJ
MTPRTLTNIITKLGNYDAESYQLLETILARAAKRTNEFRQLKKLFFAIQRKKRSLFADGAAKLTLSPRGSWAYVFLLTNHPYYLEVDDSFFELLLSPSETGPLIDFTPRLLRRGPLQKEELDMLRELLTKQPT